MTYLESIGPFLLENGYDIVPIAAGGKGPRLTGWRTIAADTATLGRWVSNGDGTGVGVRTANTPAVDIDVLDAAIVDKIVAWCDANIGLTPPRIGRAPKTLLVYRTDTTFAKKWAEYVDPEGRRHAVEILADGQQFVAFHIHPDTRQPYDWPHGSIVDIHAELLPTITEAQADALLDYFASIVPETWRPSERGCSRKDRPAGVNQKAPLTKVRDAIAVLPNDDLHYDQWIRTAHAIKAAAGENGRALFHEWGAKSEKYDYAETERAWDSIKDVTSIGAGTIFAEAAKHGFTHVPAAAVDDFDIIDVDVGVTPARAEAPRPAKSRPLQSLSLAEALALSRAAAAPYLVKGLLDQNTLAVIYGRPNSGKTFLALDLAAAVASGRPFAGRDTQGGLVFYIAAEGGTGALRRIEVLFAEGRVEEESPLRPLLQNVDLFDPKADVAALCAEVNGWSGRLGRPARLVVLDTLNRIFAGGDENSGKDMGQLIANLDRIRVATGTAVLLVHHSGKDQAKGSRGHSSLLAAIDTEFEAVKEAKAVEGIVRNTKQRDLEIAPDIRFRLRTVTLPPREDGEVVRSCVVTYPGPDEFAPLPVDAPAAEMLRALTLAIETSGNGAVPLNEWEEAYCRLRDPAWHDEKPRPKGCSERNLRDIRRSLIASSHVVESAPGRFCQRF
jgi:hypothetical protein